MGVFPIQHHNRIITCISADSPFGLKSKSFGIQYSCNWLTIERGHTSNHCLGISLAVANQILYQSTVRWDKSNILWLRPEVAQLLIDRPFTQEQTSCEYNSTLSKLVVFTNGHLILSPLFINKHKSVPPLSIHRHQIQKDPRLICREIQSYRINSGKRSISNQTHRLPENRHLKTTLFAHQILRNEFMSIIENARLSYLKSHKKWQAFVSNGTENRGLRNYGRKSAMLSSKGSDKAKVYTTNPLNQYDINMRNNNPNSYISKKDFTHLKLPLFMLEMPISASTAHNILQHYSLRSLDSRIVKIGYDPSRTTYVTSTPSKPEAIEKLAPSDFKLSLYESSKPKKKNLIGTPLSPETARGPLVGSAGPIVETVVINPSFSKQRVYKKTPKKLKVKRDHRAFFLINLLLFAQIIYISFNTFETFQFTRAVNENNFSFKTTIETFSEISNRHIPSLSGYREIWQRDLFHVITAQTIKDQESNSIDEVPYAQKRLGLVLVGTIASEDPNLSRAIIANASSNKQGAYREGEKVGEVQIKKIFLGKVIITTAEGDKLLTVEVKDIVKNDPNIKPQKIGDLSSFKKRISKRRQRRARTSTINLKQEEVAASITDIDWLITQLAIEPYSRDNQQSGFRLGRIPRDNILRKMGLYSRDVIVGIDDEIISDSDQASDFLRTIADGGEVTIKIKRGGRTRQINLNIE